MTQPGSLICFIGIDGSGKTTQAKMLVDWLVLRGIRSEYAWSRGEVLTIRNILLVLGRRALGTSAAKITSDTNSYHEYQTRKSKLMRNPFVRTLWSGLMRVEHLVQINRDIRTKIQDGWLVVCDRYLWDSIIDLAVINNKKTEWLLSGLNRLTWKFVPHPAITFFIDIPPDEALRRKDDIPSYEYVRSRADLYRYLAKRYPVKVIDGCRDVTAIQNEILDIVKNYIEG